MVREYFRYRRVVLYFYLCVMAFFPLIHYLYNLPMASILYSIMVFTFLLLTWLVIDGVMFNQKKQRLVQIKANLSTYNHDFPPAANIVEGKYQEVIEELYWAMENNRYSMENSHAERIEYYTMWVHQIKTPIAAIRLALQSGENNPIIEQELFKIEQYAEMALQFVKLDNLHRDLVIEEYKLDEIVKSSVKKYATLFIQKKLSVTIEDIDVKVITDSKWLSFIIEQLLSNAIKYTGSGGIKFSWEDNALVMEDSGIGISSGDIERIFDKGYTGYNGRLDKRASGIGLYMAKKVADTLSIQVQITSEVGTGTRAKLRFPKHLETYDVTKM